MELSQLGWNVLTLSFLGTLLFTILEAWGLVQQKKEIWNKRSGESVSVTYFVYFCFLFASFAIYGISIGSIAASVNGLVLAPLYLPIMWGLWKFKGYTRKERFTFWVLLVAVIVMVGSPGKEYFFLAFSFGSVLSSVMQPLEIWKEKSSGVVSIKLLLVFAASTAFWVVYAWAINDMPIKIVASSYLVVIMITIGVWLKYRESSPPKQAVI